MSESAPPIANLTEDALQLLLTRAFRNTLILGLLVSLALTISSGWRNGGLFLTGALISAASILEWQRLIRLINARMRLKKTSRSSILVFGFFLVRLLIFAVAIYGSLKCFQGSVIALICGLGLAVVTLTWEALRLLRE